MLLEPTARLPLALVPASFPGETTASYAARVDSAIAAKGEHHLWNLAAATYRRRTGAPSQKRVAERCLEREVHALCRAIAGDRCDRVVLLGKPSRTIWHTCLHCTDGEIVAVHPAYARLTCSVHSVWTGPMMATARHVRLSTVPHPDPTHSRPVNPAIVEAAGRIRHSGANMDLIQEALVRAASAVRHERTHIPAPEDIPVAAAIIATVTDADVIRAVCDSHTDYRLTYQLVDQRMQLAGNRIGTLATDQAWLMLRWTAAAARHRWDGEWNSEDPNPVVRPIQPLYSGLNRLQPFHTYMDCICAARADEAWWDDRYCQMINGPRYLCPEGHVSRRRPGQRSRHGAYESSCSVCSGYRVVTGYNSLADVAPWLLAEWDPDVTSGPTPWTVRPYSRKTGHWLCPNNHHYQATFVNRTLHKTGCIYCRGSRVLPGQTDMARTHPALARLWDPEAGNNTTPQEFKATNQKLRIGWRCTRGHTFTRTPANFVRSNGRCGTCQSLAIRRPDVAAQWNDQRNGSLTPEDVTPRGTKTVWWRCPKGHDFPAMIVSRCKYPKLTCSVETGKVLVPGVSDIASRFPALMLDWDFSRNTCPPNEQVPGDQKYVWTCPAGHTQEATVSNRRRAGGCTLCPPGRRASNATVARDSC
ncbi:zinc-ribbon domain-containing protein [Arthrobacter sp. 135MFCol5.1]|uniref:zinc-ribbon domain-containing protein n=1 Tax=Arthrobacter sp. 135MFCol5.1 TaxID=1158050 RepID=UPI0003A180B0